MSLGRTLAAVGALAMALTTITPARAEDPNSAVLPKALEGVGFDQKLDQQLPLALRFRDESAREVALGDYFGKRPVVMALVYYDCPMLCTLVLNGLVSSMKALDFLPARDFDVVAFSVSFEWDYTNVLTLLRLAGIPVRTGERTHHDPLVMIGGAVTFVNPEPLAPFADVIAAGEGEALIPPLVRAFKEATDRDDLLRRLVTERGYYVPSFYDVQYTGDGSIAAFTPRPETGAPPVVKKAALKTTEAVSQLIRDLPLIPPRLRDLSALVEQSA